MAAQRDRSVIKVTRVVRFSTSIASQVECDAEHDPMVPHIDGIYLATADAHQNRGNWCPYSELTSADHGHNARAFTCVGRGPYAETYVLDDSYRLRDWWICADSPRAVVRESSRVLRAAARTCEVEGNDGFSTVFTHQSINAPHLLHAVSTADAKVSCFSVFPAKIHSKYCINEHLRRRVVMDRHVVDDQ